MTTKYGLVAPLRRTARDFEAASGGILRASKVKQLLATEPGELLWRTSFGAGLGRLRHQNNDAVLRELARVSVRDAVGRWLSGARLMQLEVSQGEGAIVIAVAVNDDDEGTTETVEVRP